MNNWVLIIIILLYLALLFIIAQWAEKNKKSKWVNNPYLYAFSLAVYCSAWTYYGSIGVAATKGISFLTIYLGPVIAAPLWIIVLKKVIRISKQQKISSLADFISLRYGKNRFLGALVTLICISGILPYISLQLKAVSESFNIITHNNQHVSGNIFTDSTFYIAIILAVFSAFFGTRNMDATEKRKGILTTVAIESIIKLIFFITIGVYVTFILFDGPSDITSTFSKTPEYQNLANLSSLEEGFSWTFTIMLSFIAVFLLPRQFQVSVLENTREKHLKKAIWLFPLYLLLFNIFVIFIAWAGNIKFGNSLNPEYFTLFLPLKEGNLLLSLLVFLGGLSAVISMVVVSTLALSIMVSNNLVIPYGLINKFFKNNPDQNIKSIKKLRRIAIFIIIITAYAYYYNFSVELSLYSIGLMSFVIVAQLAPSFFIGLFWNRGSSKGAIIGMISGFMIAFYTLILPFTLEALTGDTSFRDNGLFSITSLKPHALFGIDFLSPASHAFFWSMLTNVVLYMYFSLNSKGNYRERNYAEMFVDNKNYTSLQDKAYVWKGEAYVKDIKHVLNKFLGEKKARKALKVFFTKYNLPTDTEIADAKLINYSEQLLTGIIGSASAKILISSVIKEEEISLVEVLKILEESKDAIAESKTIKEKSKELKGVTNLLKNANLKLREKDKQKDEFLDTVAHELKTPLTGIRASTELLLDDPEMPIDIKNQFLSNMLQDSERLSRLINNILDFEKLEHNKRALKLEFNDINTTITKTFNSLENSLIKHQISFIQKNNQSVIVKYDEDRIIQVLTNLISNAIKFCTPKTGSIILDYKVIHNTLEISITDNGKGISDEDRSYIFEKFYQSKDQNTIKPEGSGLGLAICKQIIKKHNGEIWLDQAYISGAKFIIKLPIHNE